MSPHAVAPQNYDPRRDHCILLESDIGSNGFLPSRPPLDRLPDPYYSPWESLIKDLPALIDDRTIRSRVQGLPVLSTSGLRRTAEWRRAYVVLSFLAHGYIWGGAHAAEVLPSPITVPLRQVSSRLDLPPVATYASTCLWNFRSASGNLAHLDSLQALHTFTGTEDESWFYAVSVAMEARGAHIIPAMLRALRAAKRGDYGTVARALEELSVCIREIHALLGRMYERCDPVVFYHRIRPFLAGSKNMAAAGLPRGVLYDDGEGGGEWLQLRGGSNGQSSLIQFLDVVLGVEHTAHGSSSPDARKTGGDGDGDGGDEQGTKEPTTSYHQEVRAYMPAAHRQFLEHVEQQTGGGGGGGGGGFRSLLAALPGDGPEQERLHAAFRTATGALTEFRNKHLEIVTRYIVIPSRRPSPGWSNLHIGLAGAAIGGRVGERAGGELTGTGGTALLPFLKQVRDETHEAGRVV